MRANLAVSTGSRAVPRTAAAGPGAGARNDTVAGRGLWWLLATWGVIVRLVGMWIVSAWRVLPGDLLGRLVVLACGATRDPRRVRVEQSDGRLLCEAIVIEDPRLARYLDHVPLRPAAQTLGRFVFARGPLPDAVVRHELEHVRQWSRYGPFFRALYGASSILAVLAAGDRYRDNQFEMAARLAEADQS